MSGTLFVVATPLGNMEDATFRAIRVLREVDLIAAEDTRRTARLLSHYAIATPSISFHQHNARTRVPRLILELQSGKNVGLVTDAGTPGISDPGVELVDACIRAQISVDPIPGASAPLTAAVASGFPLIPLTIYGFPPHRSKDRSPWFSEISAVRHTVTFFESPHRIVSSLTQAGSYFGNRPIVLARELTKLHQEFLRGSVHDVLSQLKNTKGEFTIVLGPKEKEDMSIDQTISSDAAAQAVVLFGQLTDIGRSRREAITQAAKTFGLPVRVVYAAVEDAKKSAK